MSGDRASICRVVAWNAEWAPPRGVRGRRVAGVLAALEADIIVLTEGHPDLLPSGGHVVEGEALGSSVMPGARRVLLWSRTPLSDVDPIGDPELPHQAFVSARTTTAVGEVDVMSICIPWADADVARFGGTKARWEEHEFYLRILGRMLRTRAADRPLIVAGDFNQYVPRIWGPKRLSELLLETFSGLSVATEGPIAGLGTHVIDHVVHSPDLVHGEIVGWLGRTDDDRPLSDHSGVRVDLRRRA